MLSGLALPHAAASNLGDLQAQAQRLEAEINALGNQESQLSEQYDSAVYALKGARERVAQAKAAVAQANSRAGRARSVLRADAVNAYINNGSGSVSGSGQSSSIAGADASLLRAEYEQSLATNQADSEDQYRLASKEADSAEITLKTEEAAAAKNVETIAGDVKQVEATQASLERAESQDKGRIATLIAAQRAAALRAQQVAADQRIAAAQAAEQAQAQQAAANRQASTTSATEGQTTPTEPSTPPTTGGSGGGSTPVPTGGGSVAEEAVHAALSRVGDPYVWGAAGPNAFDCSGLVMWAYAQAGVSLPHFSGAQYADTTHISMGDLEPGDLVFFSDPGEHVAMYIGNGDIVQAPYTGADVQVVPLFSEFTLASRVS
jgi:cell wall-associated NlpC family hydrolase